MVTHPNTFKYNTLNELDMYTHVHTLFPHSMNPLYGFLQLLFATEEEDMAS